MPKLFSLHDKAEIEAFARKNPSLHIYELGDLDDFFWSNTIWYSWREGNAIQQLALLYTAPAIPVLLAYGDPPQAQMTDFMRALLPLLPRQIYTHVEAYGMEVLSEAYEAIPNGLYWKMALTRPDCVDEVDTTDVIRFTEADLPPLQAFYDEAYPGSAFVARMLQTRFYYGLREGDKIQSVAGVHSYSPEYKAAAIGNVTTHPAFYGKGLATKVCAALVKALQATGIDHIGLNVRADNAPAIAVYKRLGFEWVGDYYECTFK